MHKLSRPGFVFFFFNLLILKLKDQLISKSLSIINYQWLRSMHRACLESCFLLRWMAGNTICGNQQSEIVVDWECRLKLSKGWGLALPLPSPLCRWQRMNLDFTRKTKQGGGIFIAITHGKNAGKRQKPQNTGFLSKGSYLGFGAHWLTLLLPGENCPPEELQGGARNKWESTNAKNEVAL